MKHVQSPRPRLSIVIPAFNEEHFLPRTVRRTRRAVDATPALRNSCEFIVCDNNSTDRTAETARRLGCRVVFEPHNQISRARNRGARAARGEWLLFLDADSWPSPGLIADLAENLRNPSIIGCGATIRVADGPWWFKLAWESKNWNMRLFGWSPGAFLACRREAFAHLRGFSTGHYIFEEYDFVQRLKRLGRKRAMRFRVLHRHPFSTSGRKGASYSLGSWLTFATRLWLSPGKTVRDRQVADKWYRIER